MLSGPKLVRTVQFILGALAAACGPLAAQQILSSSDGKAHPLFSDVAILEEGTARKDLPCTVTPDKPELGFDYRFRSGYDVTVPLKELSDEEGRLTMVFRVTPTDHPGDPVYLAQHVSVPEIESDAKGDAELSGDFAVGEGKYHVGWLMRDRTERICSSSWDIEASLPARDKPMPLNIAPDEVRALDLQQFHQEPRPAEKDPGDGLRLRVLVNFAPQDQTHAVWGPEDVNAILSMLRTMARDPRVGTFSMVAFNAQEQRVIYRQQEAPWIDFPALGRAAGTLNLGLVDAKQLAQKHGQAEFLGELLTKEIGGNPDQPDAVIIAGPKGAVDDTLPADALKALGETRFPVFYINYDLAPVVQERDAIGNVANPWRDAIGNAVRAIKGIDYTIGKPRDVYFSWIDIASHIVKSKVGRSGPGENGQKP